MFEGFTQETSEFLWELSFHNERPWFLEHKEQFERVLNRPFKALAEDTVKRMQELFPDRPMLAHVSRIYRDARRLFGRGPYKDHLWFTVKGDGNYQMGPMFWFEIHAATYSYGLGFFDVTPAEMERFRRTVDADPARFERLAKQIQRDGRFRVIGQEYSRVKGSYDEPVRSYYNRKVLGLECQRDFGGDLLSPELPEILAQAYRSLMPMHDYFLSVHNAAKAAGETWESRRSHG